MSKKELRSSGERRRRGFANGAGEPVMFYCSIEKLSASTMYPGIQGFRF